MDAHGELSSYEIAVTVSAASLWRTLSIAPRILCLVGMIMLPVTARAVDSGRSASCSLPVLDDVIDEALKILPGSLTDYSKLEKRMRLSVLWPDLQLQYGGNEANFSRGSSMRDSGLRWENDVRVTLRWDLSEFLFNNQETDAIAIYQRAKDNEIDLRTQIAGDYVDLKYALDQWQREGAQGGVALVAEQRATKIDVLTSNRFRLVDLVHNCSANRPGG